MIVPIPHDTNDEKRGAPGKELPVAAIGFKPHQAFEDAIADCESYQGSGGFHGARVYHRGAVRP